MQENKKEKKKKLLLKGKKVVLRPMRSKEVDLIHKWANNPENIPFWYGKRKTLQQVKADWKPHYFSDKDSYSGRCFAILKDDEAIGMINYNQIDKDNRNTDIDIIIGHRKNWNKGYGTDAVVTLAGYLFKHFRLHRISLGVYIHNPRAIQSYKKAGFKQEGIMREEALVQGKFVDTVWMGLLRPEFKQDNLYK